jgi:hypothetical protein
MAGKYERLSAKQVDLDYRCWILTDKRWLGEGNGLVVFVSRFSGSILGSCSWHEISFFCAVGPG